MNSVHQLYSIDLSTFRVALLICYPQRGWNFVIVILFECCDASPRPRPTAIPDVYPCPSLRNVGNYGCFCSTLQRVGSTWAVRLFLWGDFSDGGDISQIVASCINNCTSFRLQTVLSADGRSINGAQIEWKRY
jgi:hypothetical protein